MTREQLLAEKRFLACLRLLHRLREEGLLSGFGNTEITGFQSAATFGPVIGTIPFIGYLFQLDDPGAGAAFCQVLQDAADPQWNICTQADETIVRQDGDLVFFLMCPLDWAG